METWRALLLLITGGGAAVGGDMEEGSGCSGHVSDAQTGLSPMQQRQYNPRIGRFLSIDPVTAFSNQASALSQYCYANNTPYKFTDPDERTAVCIGSSCQLDCSRVITRTADYVHVGTTYAGRLLQNSIEGRRPSNEPAAESSPGGREISILRPNEESCNE